MAGSGDGILGGTVPGLGFALSSSSSPPASSSSSSWLHRRHQQVKRRERWLVLLGIALHAIYMLSIFDICFKSPIVHGMDPVPQRISPPANRFVLLVADGPTSYFEPDSDGNFRAPFLRSVILIEPRAVGGFPCPAANRVQAGHVSIIAGFFEDPSAVTKGVEPNYLIGPGPRGDIGLSRVNNLTG